MKTLNYAGLNNEGPNYEDLNYEDKDSDKANDSGKANVDKDRDKNGQEAFRPRPHRTNSVHLCRRAVVRFLRRRLFIFTFDVNLI